MSEQSKTASGRPRGLTILALMMMLVGGIWFLAALILPVLHVAIAPWYIYLGAAAYFLIVGVGLWRARRWAYVCALLMCLVLAHYAILNAVVLQRNALLSFILVATVFVYLLTPHVRATFFVPPANDHPTEKR